MLRWCVVVPMSVALGWAFNALHLPAAWILGAIVASGAVALRSGRDLPINEYLFQFTRGVIGVLAALPLVGIPPAQLLPFLPPGLMAAASMIGLAYVGGAVLARKGVSQETGVLSLLAGGASLMPVIAKEIGADVRYVALTQYLRLLVVSMTLPVVAGLLTTTQGSTAGHLDPYWWMWLLVPALVVAGQPIAKVLRIPNPSIFGPMILTAVVGSFMDVVIVPPEPLNIAAFLCLGWACGGGLSVPALKQFSRLLPITIGYIAGLMAACAGVGWLLALWLNISFYEGYLATTPGALETVLALTAEGGVGPAVVAIQLIRLICILLFASYLPKLVGRQKRKRQR
ncbi:AbrB family transcriptional regulator [Corynebacterium sp. NML130628]|uniref:AbrB family transcriptional regulator n=1 Tax=Corynebacterium sp. NML130628 TaxID=1906333 RepID=UPI0008FBA113|nr:AbrB family transcriptional regulator [Corynebacterium sp. NML130628]OIR43608.1 ammonia monooxygenase [Corynebacterium sp. NML130628]